MAESESEKQRRIEYIDRELQILCYRCVKQGKSWTDIRSNCDPFLKKNHRWNKITLFNIAIVICVFATVVTYRPCSRFVSAVTSQALISVLPMWDWRWIHGLSCAWSNPYLLEDVRELETIHCQLCEELSSVPRLQEASSQQVAETYLDNDLPVLVEDSQQKITTVDGIIKLYLDDKVLNLYSCCDFQSSIQVPFKNHRLFLKWIREGQYSSYFAHWTNCFKEAAKLFRTVYTRPPFIPPSLELTEANWLFMSSLYKDEVSVVPPIEENVMILIQLSGDLNVTLTPKDVCEVKCQQIQVTLHLGSTLFVPNFLYEVSYQPSQGEDSITVGLGASFD